MAADTAAPVHAASYFVNSTKDGVDERPGDGRCSTGVRIEREDGGIELECTLRAAIQESNAVAGVDTIPTFLDEIQVTTNANGGRAFGFTTARGTVAEG